MGAVQLGMIPQIDESFTLEEKEKALDEIRQLEKAHIVMMEDCTVECGDYEEMVQYEEGQIIPAQFNPTSYKISVNANFKDEFSGLEQSLATVGAYSGGPIKRTLSVELMYDTMFTVDYLDKMQDIFSTTKDAVKSVYKDTSTLLDQAGKVFEVYSKYSNTADLNESYIKLITNLARATELGRPPLISFRYGNLNFMGHVASVDVDFIRFDKSGEVVRAKVGITIDEAMSDEKNPGGGLGGKMGAGDAALTNRGLDILKALA